MKLNIFISSIIAASFMLIMSCSDMESIHEVYLDGEQIYSGKLDSLDVYSGYNRLKIVGLTRYLGNSIEATAEWNDTSVTVPIENIAEGKFEMLIENLPEQNYEFRVHTKDVEGNLSIYQNVVGRAEGDIFKASQNARRILGFVYASEGLSAEWADKSESPNVAYTHMLYENRDGGVNEEYVLPNESYTLLENWVKGGNIKIVSSVVTGENGFDTLVLDPIYSKFPLETVFELDKSQISLVHMPSDNPGTGYGALPDEFLFNGNPEYRGDVEGYHSDEFANPHHLTIDLGVFASIRKFRVDLRTDNFKGNNPTEFQLWGIDDITNAETNPADETNFIAKGWVLLHTESNIDNTQAFKEVELPEGSPRVRYVRYRVTQSPSGAAQATEMTFWGENISNIK